MFKKILKISIAFFSLIAFIYLFSKWHFSPNYSGKVKLASLSQPADVYYDNFGIPHITAKNTSDLYKTFGYVTMQDRFFQIQMQKMIGSGRLSEWFGNKTLETDKVIRTIGIKHYTNQWYKNNISKINPKLIADLNAWLIGVNDCVLNCPRPIEMILLNVQPEQILIEDVLAFSGIMSFSFTKAYYGDALITKLSKSISDAQLEELVGSTTKNFTTTKNQFNPDIKNMFTLDPENYLPQLDGSQSWVLSAKKSASGFATLANDPHIAFSTPGVWYEAHLKSADFELYGHFVPIIPFALIGRNFDMAWGLTMSNSDEIDLILDSNINNTVERSEIIYVKNENNFNLIVKSNTAGPVINNLLKDKQDAIMSWHYFRNDNFTIEAFYDLAHAKNLSEFYNAVEKGKSPGLNILWADKNGNIAWKILGHFPKRSEPFWKIRSSKIHELENTTAVDKKEVPYLENPDSGYILSANQKPPTNYDESKISGYWDSNERFDSLKSDLENNDKIDINFQKKMFLNNNFFGAAERLQKMLVNINADPQLLEKLSNWDSQANLNNISQGFYQFWIDEIMKIVFLDYLNESELDQFCGTTNYWKFAIRIIDQPQSEWWNNQYEKTLQTAFDKTLDFFQKNYGTTNNWSWQELHQLQFEHPLGKVRPLNYFFNLGPYPVDGGFMVPNAFRHKLCSRNFNVTSGASTRRLIDFKNPAEGFGILPTGNSGVPFSKHYSDQVELYLKGEFRPETMQWENILNFSDHLMLLPE